MMNKSLQFLAHPYDPAQKNSCYHHHPNMNLHKIYRVVITLNFELAGGALIIINAMLLAAQLSETDRYAGAGIYGIAEQFFTLVFFFEWMLRVVAYGWTMVAFLVCKHS